MERARADLGEGKPEALTTAEREELAAHRKKVRNLEMERDFPETAAAFFAEDYQKILAAKGIDCSVVNLSTRPDQAHSQLGC